MSKPLFGAPVALLFLVALCPAAPVAPPPDWNAAIKDREFQFDKAHTGVYVCAEAAKKAGAEVGTDGDADRGNVELKVAQGGKPVTLLAHGGSAFAVRDGVLFFADFSPYASGCKVVAYDLKSSKKLWDQPLKGLGPIAHFRYRNQVTLAIEKHPTAAAWAVVITGLESAGKYLELLDPRTGKQLAHKKFDR
jgi:hypothetical protein